MEKITNFVIDPIFKENQMLLDELIFRVAYVNGYSIFGEWSDFDLVIGPDGMDDQLIGADQPGIPMFRVYSNWLLIKTSHQLICLRSRLEARIKKLEEEVEKKKEKQKERKKRNNFNRKQRRKAQARRMKAHS